MASSSLQALLTRAGTALEQGRGPEAVQILSPMLRAPLPREDDLAVRSALTEAWLLQDDVDQAALSDSLCTGSMLLDGDAQQLMEDLVGFGLSEQGAAAVSAAVDAHGWKLA